MNNVLTLHTAIIISLLLTIALIIVWLYAMRINNRLNQAIKLINDLYNVSQRQEELINGFNKDAYSDSSEDKTAYSQLSNNICADVKTNFIDDVQKNVAQLQSSLNKRLENLEHQYVKIENQTMRLQEQDPAIKMYTRANQLLKQGASIEDIIESCDLPRAEVEVLIGLQRKKN